VSDIDPQEFGRLQAQVEILLQSNKVMADTLETMAVSLQAMRLEMAEARGGWKLMMALGGAAASLGGLISWALTTFSARGSG
jgi:hypothetical protein